MKFSSKILQQEHFPVESKDKRHRNNYNAIDSVCEMKIETKEILNVPLVHIQYIFITACIYIIYAKLLSIISNVDWANSLSSLYIFYQVQKHI